MIPKKPFVQYLEKPDFQPNQAIIKALDKIDFPFLKNSFFNYNPAYLGADEFNRCTEEYNLRTPKSSYEDLLLVIAMMIVKEDGLRDQLEQLAQDVIRKMYNIPFKISMDVKLKYINIVESFEVPEENTIDESRKPYLRQEIEKRRILNTIVHGGSIHQWSTASYLAYEELNKLNPDLIKLYDQYSALINYYNWQTSSGVTGNIPTNTIQGNTSINFSIIQGLSYVKNDGKKGQIMAEAISFPVALHELSKGALSYLINKGIPDLPENELKYVLRKADRYEHEYWHYYMGPTLWRAILNTANVNSVELPKIIMKLSQMSYEELAQFCVDIVFFNEEEGKNKMNNLKKDINIQ